MKKSLHFARYAFIGGILLLLDGCATKTSDPTVVIPPGATTQAATSITETTAVVGGSATGDQIIAKGVVYNTTSNPQLGDMFTDRGPDAGSFSSTISGLEPGTTYFVRAYATSLNNGTAYGSELSFTTIISDNTAPSVQSVSPGDNDTNVSTGTTITITFSEEVNSTSTQDIQLKNTKDASVVATTISASGGTVTVTPTSSLKGSTTYQLTIPASVKDMADNSLGSDVVTSFTTENIELTLVSSSPANSANDVTIESTIQVTLSATIDASTVNGNSVYIYMPTRYELADGTLTVNGSAITFTPTDPLREYNEIYNVYVTTDVKDLDGNHPTTDQMVSFNTEKFSENYYYRFISFSQNTKALDVVGGTYDLQLATIGPYTGQFWRFTKYGATGNYLLSCDYRGFDYLIEAAAANDGNPILLTGWAAVGVPYTGQVWNPTKGVNYTSNYTFVSVNLGTGYLLTDDLDMRPNTAANSQYWTMERLYKFQ